MVVILDNGHGVDTAGKRSPAWNNMQQLFEWEFTRDIVHRVHTELDELSINNVILVPESRDISLQIRVNRANAIFSKDKNSFLISIHGNAALQPNQGTGWEVWTSPGETESDIIATHLYNAAKKYLNDYKIRTDYTDGDPDKESRFYVLVRTLCPAALTENLFYDNEKDCRFMLSEIGRSAIANLHVEAIRNYLLK
jgi:N-acetylmuramoyl-L-alanine amidase